MKNSSRRVAIASGPMRSAVPVESTMSQKSAVTVLRSPSTALREARIRRARSGGVRVRWGGLCGSPKDEALSLTGGLVTSPPRWALHTSMLPEEPRSEQDHCACLALGAGLASGRLRGQRGSTDPTHSAALNARASLEITPSSSRSPDSAVLGRTRPTVLKILSPPGRPGSSPGSGIGSVHRSGVCRRRWRTATALAYRRGNTATRGRGGTHPTR